MRDKQNISGVDFPKQGLFFLGEAGFREGERKR